MFTQSRIQQLLYYDPLTGAFTWKTGSRRSKKAGHKHYMGHNQIYIYGTCYQAGRVAWLYMTGHWPKHEVDHINCDGYDDRFANLREATRAQNQWNTRKPSTNKTGVKGVSLSGNKKPFRAKITVNKKVIHLGYFDTVQEAANARKFAASILHRNFARL